MQDRTPLYPGRVKLAPVEGQANVYDMTREDSPTQPGTPLSKATFLKDATAALFGLGSDAVPDDALALLSRFHKGLGNEYVWEKVIQTIEPGYTEYQYGPNTILVQLSPSSSSGSPQSATFHYGDSYVLNEDGKTISIPNETTFSASYSSDASVLNVLKGKWWWSTRDGAGNVYYLPSNAEITKKISGSYYNFNTTVGQTWRHDFYPATKTTFCGYVNSPDPNAYPPAVSDGYTYTPLGQVGSCAHIETGTYVGTGNNACSIQYERTPKFVAIFSKTTTNSSDEIPFAFFMPELGSGVITYPKSSQQNYCYVANCYLRDNAFKTSNSYMDISGRTYQYIMLS